MNERAPGWQPPETPAEIEMPNLKGVTSDSRDSRERERGGDHCGDDFTDLNSCDFDPSDTPTVVVVGGARKSDGSSMYKLPITLTEFMSEWYSETIRWTSALAKVTANESEANRELLSVWFKKWTSRLAEAVEPVAEKAFGADGSAELAEVRQELLERFSQQGIKV